jgi:hypothetical protein
LTLLFFWDCLLCWDLPSRSMSQVLKVGWDWLKLFLILFLFYPLSFDSLKIDICCFFTFSFYIFWYHVSSDEFNRFNKFDLSLFLEKYKMKLVIYKQEKCHKKV